MVDAKNDDKRNSRSLIGKTVVSKSGKKFGVVAVGDFVVVAEEDIL